MNLKRVAFLLICPLFLLSACRSENLEKCKQYVGEYSDRGQTLRIMYENSAFVLEEGGQQLPCNCNSKGQLEVKGLKATMVIILSDSAGKKRFCFEADSLQEDCIYALDK